MTGQLYFRCIMQALPEIELPEILGKLYAMVTAAVDYLRGILPIDNGAVWLKENVPIFASVDQPSLVMAFGMLVLWLIASVVSEIFRRYTKLFAAGIVIIVITGYMGMI